MSNLIQMLIQILNLKRLGNAFMSKRNLGDSYKLISSFFSIQVICNVYNIVCFHLCMNQLVSTHGEFVCVRACVRVCVCVSVCVCLHVYTLRWIRILLLFSNFERQLSTKRSYILKQNFFKYVWPFGGHQAPKDSFFRRKNRHSWQLHKIEILPLAKIYPCKMSRTKNLLKMFILLDKSFVCFKVVFMCMYEPISRFACMHIFMSSNINEVIKAVLNLFFFFLRRHLTHTKSTKKH